LFWLVVILLILVAWRVRVASRIQSATRDLVVAAAQRCGLRDDDLTEEITPEELHERALASPARSAELLPDKP
jgi:hypothetical protein